MNNRRVLLTAFEPFDGDEQNSSQQVAEFVLPSLQQRCALRYTLLPVVRWRASEQAIREIDAFQPELVIMLGQAGKRRRVTPERVAVNMDWFPIPDNAGNQPLGESICKDGPAAYFSTLPVTSIADRANDQGIASKVSNTAGLYVCNHVFYAVMHHIARMAPAPIAGFIHLPRVADGNTGGGRGLPLASMAAAVALALEECLDCPQREV